MTSKNNFSTENSEDNSSLEPEVIRHGRRRNRYHSQRENARHNETPEEKKAGKKPRLRHRFDDDDDDNDWTQLRNVDIHSLDLE